MKRWSSNQIVLAVLAVVMLLAGIDIGRRLVAGEPVEKVEPPKPRDLRPAFRQGDPAPDFEMTDENETPRHFRQMVHRDTVLAFSCGCNNCRQFQTYLAAVVKKLGNRAPDVISANTTDAAAHEAWQRDTGLKQRFLYYKHGDAKVEGYKGEPCPRAFRLDKQGNVTHIGISPGAGNSVESVSYDLAGALGFATPGHPKPGRPAAPTFVAAGESSPSLPPGVMPLDPPAPPKAP